MSGAPASRSSVAVIPVPGLPLFKAGDDLGGCILDGLARAGLALQAGDVLVVAQKIVSKAEGRAVRLAEVAPGEAARRLAAESGKHPAVAQLILDEAAAVMRVRPNLIIVRHRLGMVAANAGIDTSNVQSGDGETVLLWPVDPDASARRLRQAIEAAFGFSIAVVISDSLGRAWRMGTVGSAIGTSGLLGLIDRRGETDLFGRVLQATWVARADELAAAASLVIGEAAEGVPVAIIRGAFYIRDEDQGIGPMLRPLQEDLFT